MKKGNRKAALFLISEIELFSDHCLDFSVHFHVCG